MAEAYLFFGGFNIIIRILGILVFVRKQQQILLMQKKQVNAYVPARVIISGEMTISILIPKGSTAPAAPFFYIVRGLEKALWQNSEMIFNGAVNSFG